MADQASKEFVISRVFDAPRDLVWQCFTDPERMKHWWGPKGFTVIATKMDLRVGGTYHYGMTAPNGASMWGLFTYREIVPQDKLIFVNSFSDEKRRRHAPPRQRDLAAAHALDLHFRGRARRQDQVHRALADARRHA